MLPVQSGTRLIAGYVAPMAIFLVLTAAESWLPAGWYPLAYACKLAIVCAALLVLREPLSDIRPSGRVVAPSVVVGLLVCVLWVGLEKLVPYPHLGSRVGFNPFEAIGDPRGQYAFVLVRLFGLAIVVPVMEELFWRSFVMRWLEHPQFEAVPPQRVTIKPVVLSTFAFMLVHPLWLAAIVAGAAYAALYVRTGRLWNAVIAHAVTNGALGVWVVATGHWQFW